MPLKRFAEVHNIGYRTAYRHWQNGLLDGIKLATGTILVKGWKSEEQEAPSSKDQGIIFLRTKNEDNDAVLSKMKDIASDRGIIVAEIIIWNGYAFEENTVLADIIKKGIKTIITTKKSDLFGVNHQTISLLFEGMGWDIIALESPDNIPAMVKGIIQSSSRMAKAAVGMHTFKKDIAHYNNNLLS